MPSFNEHFMENMMGKEVTYDIQPYEFARGEIVGLTPRMIQTKDFCPHRGRMKVEYEVFDMEVKVSEGSRTGAFWGGVAVSNTTHELAGQTRMVTGVTVGQIRESVLRNHTIVIARCG